MDQQTSEQAKPRLFVLPQDLDLMPDLGLYFVCDASEIWAAIKVPKSETRNSKYCFGPVGYLPSNES